MPRYDHFVASYLAWDRLFYRGVFTMRIGTSIISAASLSFLGSVRSRRHQSGVQCSMRHERIGYRAACRCISGPGYFSDRTAFNLLGDGLRDALDPKIKG